MFVHKIPDDLFQYSNFLIGAIKEIFIQKSDSFFSSPLSDAQYKKSLAEGKAEFLSFIPRELFRFLLYIVIIILGMIINEAGSINYKSILPSVATLLIIAQRLPTVTNRVYKICFSIINTWPILKDFKTYNEEIIYKNKYKKFIYREKKLSKIVLKETYIGYKNFPPLFSIDSLNVKSGSSLIIFGKSGIGKTTFMETILKLREPISGDVFFLDKNNKYINEFRSISYVPQIFNLPSNNVIDCLSLTNPSLRNFRSSNKIKNNIKRVLKMCKVWDDFIFSFDDLNTYLGNACSNLSGGQRQRLAIARAILQEKQILVLDEATSSLDSKTELEVIESLTKNLKDTTILAISHSSQIIPFFENFYDLEKIIKNNDNL